MQVRSALQEQQVIGKLIFETAQSLVRLDAARLEDLAASCRMLRENLWEGTFYLSHEEASEARKDMAVLISLLKMTRANLHVLQSKLSDRRESLDYGEKMTPAWMCGEGLHGDH